MPPYAATEVQVMIPSEPSNMAMELASGPVLDDRVAKLVPDFATPAERP